MNWMNLIDMMPKCCQRKLLSQVLESEQKLHGFSYKGEIFHVQRNILLDYLEKLHPDPDSKPLVDCNE